MTAVFKRFNKAKVVGSRTLGWGTVENTFPITTSFNNSEHYSVLLVHSLTLREDGEAIEGRGVDPDVDTSNPDWQDGLSDIFKSDKFVQDIIDIIKEK